MIFVTVGTIQYPFGRMAHYINSINLHNSRLQHEKILVQSGETFDFKARKNLTIKKYYPMSSLKLLMQRARIVLTHGGEGSVFQALMYAKFPPIIAPRNPKYGEHVDSQQLEIGYELKRRKLAIVLEDLSLLEPTIENFTHLVKGYNRYRENLTKRSVVSSRLKQYTEELIAS